MYRHSFNPEQLFFFPHKATHEHIQAAKKTWDAIGEWNDKNKRVDVVDHRRCSQKSPAVRGHTDSDALISKHNHAHTVLLRFHSWNKVPSVIIHSCALPIQKHSASASNEAANVKLAWKQIRPDTNTKVILSPFAVTLFVIKQLRSWKMDLGLAQTTFVHIYSDCTWMDDAGIALIDGVAAAGDCVAHWSPLDGTPTADHVILAAASAHNVPLWTRTVIVQVPVI